VSPFLGGAPTLVKSVARGSIYLRHWSNDGSAIFYEFNGNLLRLDLTTHGEQHLTNFEPSRLIERNFSLSPDESRIVYCDEQNGQIDLWVNQIAGGEPVRLTNDPEKEDHPVWHPDGKQIVYSVVRDGHHQISIAYLEGRRSEQVTRGEGEHQLIDVSADGKNMFYTSWEERSDVWRVSVDTGLESQVAAEKESEFWPDVSPDGKSVLYQTNSALESIPSITDSSIIISSLSGEVQPRVIKGYDPRWLPDGRHIGFLRWQGPEKRYSFWTADSVTGEEVQLIDQRVGPPGYATLPYNRLSVREFSWTPDSSQVAFISFRSGTSNVFKKVSGTTEAIGLTQNSDPSIVFSSPLFSPRGKQIAYVSVQRSAGEGTKTTSRVWIDEDGLGREVYSTDERIRLLGWTKSDGLILESSKDPVPTNLGEIMLIKLVGPGEPKTVAALKNAYSDSAALSIDGGTVTFTARQDKKDDIFTVPVDGGPQKKITSNNDPRIYIGSLVWSPDGKYIFFDKQQRVNTISMFENF
jgi:Tol biopolymer transport system component